MPRERLYTERMSFTVPIEVKARMKADARARGLSLSAHVRDKIDDWLAWEELKDAVAALQQQGR